MEKFSEVMLHMVILRTVLITHISLTMQRSNLPVKPKDILCCWTQFGSRKMQLAMIPSFDQNVLELVETGFCSSKPGYSWKTTEKAIDHEKGSVWLVVRIER